MSDASIASIACSFFNFVAVVALMGGRNVVLRAPRLAFGLIPPHSASFRFIAPAGNLCRQRLGTGSASEDGEEVDDVLVFGEDGVVVEVDVVAN